MPLGTSVLLNCQPLILANLLKQFMSCHSCYDCHLHNQPDVKYILSRCQMMVGSFPSMYIWQGSFTGIVQSDNQTSLQCEAINRNYSMTSRPALVVLTSALQA